MYTQVVPHRMMVLLIYADGHLESTCHCIICNANIVAYINYTNVYSKPLVSSIAVIVLYRHTYIILKKLTLLKVSHLIRFPSKAV